MFRKFFSASRGFLTGIGRLLVEFFFPLECVGCGADREILCPSCQLGMAPDKHLALPTGYMEGLFVAITDYSIIEQYVWQLKYNSVVVLAEPLAGLMIQRLEKVTCLDRPIVVPVPLHRRRQKRRGYNQSAEMAKFVSRRFGWEVREDILVRKKFSKPQVGLRRESRLKNVAGVFQSRIRLEGRNILLVDDIFTTGATMNDCARALSLAGAGKVYAVVLAEA